MLPYLSTRSLSLVHGLDDTDGHGLPHITDGETAERSVVSEGLDTERLSGMELNDAGVSILEELWVVFHLEADRKHG